MTFSVFIMNLKYLVRSICFLSQRSMTTAAATLNMPKSFFTRQRLLKNGTPVIFMGMRKFLSQGESWEVAKPDELYSQVQLLIKGQDLEVIKSYVAFIKMSCQHLEVEYEEPVMLPRTRRMITLMKSRHVHKRAKVQYEVRTHHIKVNLQNMTGSSCSCFLEYIQRNIPEAVAMQVNRTQLMELPSQIIASSLSTNSSELQ